MNPEYLRGCIDELDAQIECEEDPSRALCLIRERLEAISMLLSLKEDEEKANTA